MAASVGASSKPTRQPLAARPRAPRGTLTPELIKDAALRIIDSEGLSSLTMRRLADDLSVKPMSLYSHFLNKESLLSSIKEGLFLAIAEELGPDDETASWSAQLRRVFEVVHHTCIEHPSFIPLLISTPMTPASEARANADRRTLIRAGFNAEETALALKALVAHLVGDSLIDYGRSDHGAIDVIETTRSDPATYFNFGLTVLLDGLEARLKNSIQ